MMFFDQILQEPESAKYDFKFFLLVLTVLGIFSWIRIFRIRSRFFADPDLDSGKKGLSGSVKKIWFRNTAKNHTIIAKNYILLGSFLAGFNPAVFRLVRMRTCSSGTCGAGRLWADTGSHTKTMLPASGKIIFVESPTNIPYVTTPLVSVEDPAKYLRAAK